MHLQTKHFQHHFVFATNVFYLFTKWIGSLSYKIHRPGPFRPVILYAIIVLKFVQQSKSVARADSDK